MKKTIFTIGLLLYTFYQGMVSAGTGHSLTVSTGTGNSLTVSTRIGNSLTVSTRIGNSLTTNALLQSVVVYRLGAELTHTASAGLPEGNVELSIDRLSNDIDLNSVQIHAPMAVTLLGFSYESDYLTVKPKTARQQQLEDSLDRLTEGQEKVQLAMMNNDDLLEVLKKNRELKGAETGMNVTDLMKLMDYYKTKSLELTELQYQLKKRYTLLAESIDKMSAQIKEEETKNTRESGRLLLKLAVATAGSYDFTISYITGHAAWTPAYELRVKDGQDSVKVVYKANINQTTGLDWKQVKMALSTSVPGSWSRAPEMNPLFLSFQEKQKEAIANALSGRVAGLSVNSQLDEVVVIGYGTERKRDIQTSIQSRKLPILPESKPLYTEVDEQRLNTIYTIDLPYDLPSTGKDQLVSLQNMEVPALFKYFAIPKISDDIYLLADIPNWGKLNLLPGKANIMLNGTYVGLTTIDPTSTLDTLHLTVGKDKRINIQRQKISDLSSEKFLNANQHHQYAYEITIRNNKNENINLSLLDQYPLSTNKDIDITLNDSGSAIVNSDRGELKWNVVLKSGESRKLHFGYTVKYPKDEQLTMK